MTKTLKTRNRQLAIRFTVTLLIFILLGSALALTLRKVQSQRQLLTLHTKILANLPLMQTETTNLRQQVAAFRQALPPGLGSRSADLLLYARVDQIKSVLQPSEMTVTGPESKDGVQTLVFTLKVPLARYSALVNDMGQLQTELFPFVDFREISLAPSPSDTSIVVVGNVLLPPVSGGTP